MNTAAIEIDRLPVPAIDARPAPKMKREKASKRSLPVTANAKAASNDERDLAWAGEVFFTIPAGSKLRSAKKSGFIEVRIAARTMLKIIPPSGMLNSLDLTKEQRIAGYLELVRAPLGMRGLDLATLTVRPMRSPGYTLTHRQMSKGLGLETVPLSDGAVWNMRLCGSLLEIVKHAN